MDMSINSAYLFLGMDRGISLLEEETYIFKALNSDGIRYGAFDTESVDDLSYVSRWPENKFPLRVYLEPDYGCLFTPGELHELVCLVQKTLDTITDVNPDLFQFRFTANTKDADIIIRYKRSDRHEYSHCIPEVGDEKQITRAEIRLYVPVDFSPEWVVADCMHNMLRALGVQGFSDNDKDSGYDKYSFIPRLLSNRDSKTLQLLYRCPLAMTRREIMMLWQDYQDKYLMLPMNGTLETIMSNMDRLDPVMKYQSGILVKSGDLSQREVELQKMFNTYLEKLTTA